MSSSGPHVVAVAEGGRRGRRFFALMSTAVSEINVPQVSAAPSVTHPEMTNIIVAATAIT
jgi:hypothetical protein